MSFSRILALMARVIRQFIRDRRSMALLFLAPLLILTILNFVLNSSSAGVALGIVLPSNTAGDTLYSQIAQRVSGQANLTIKRIMGTSPDDALKKGEVDGVLIFPDDFVSQMQSGTTPIVLTFRLEGSSPAAAKQLTGLTTLITQSLSSAFLGVNRPGGTNTGGVTFQVQPTYLYGGAEFTQTDALAPLLVGLFSFFFVFLLTSVAFLRERSQGTIERLMVSPLRRSELVLGYVGGFTIFALLQSLVVLLFVIGVLQVHYHGNVLLLLLVTLTLTIGGVNLGIFVSAFARNELQVIQFIPLLLVPQILLGGLFFPIKTLPIVLHQLAYALPLTYANFALQDIMLRGFGLEVIWPDLLFLVGFAAAMVGLSAFSLRGERV